MGSNLKSSRDTCQKPNSPIKMERKAIAVSEKATLSSSLGVGMKFSTVIDCTIACIIHHMREHQTETVLDILSKNRYQLSYCHDKHEIEKKKQTIKQSHKNTKIYEFHSGICLNALAKGWQRFNMNGKRLQRAGCIRNP